MHYKDIKQRYQTDPTIRRVVDTMFSLLVDTRITPGEMRDCAMLAAVEFESRFVTPHVIVPKVGSGG